MVDPHETDLNWAALAVAIVTNVTPARAMAKMGLGSISHYDVLVEQGLVDPTPLNLADFEDPEDDEDATYE